MASCGDRYPSTLSPPSPYSLPSFLTIAEVAALRRVSNSTVRRAVASGLLDSTTDFPDGRARIPKTAALAWCASSVAPHAPPPDPRPPDRPSSAYEAAMSSLRSTVDYDVPVETVDDRRRQWQLARGLVEVPCPRCGERAWREPDVARTDAEGRRWTETVVRCQACADVAATDAASHTNHDSGIGWRRKRGCREAAIVMRKAATVAVVDALSDAVVYPVTSCGQALFPFASPESLAPPASRRRRRNRGQG